MARKEKDMEMTFDSTEAGAVADRAEMQRSIRMLASGSTALISIVEGYQKMVEEMVAAAAAEGRPDHVPEIDARLGLEKAMCFCMRNEIAKAKALLGKGGEA